MTRVDAAALLSEPLGPEMISTPEWHGIRTGQHNVLFEGPDQATERFLQLLRPFLCTPTVWTIAPGPLEFPPGETGSVVLRNVSALDRGGQAALLRWLDAPNGRKQVIATAVNPLFPLTTCGLFDEALYYRLNVILLRVVSPRAQV